MQRGAGYEESEHVMKVYVAIVSGVYRHQVIGVYTDQALARSRAEAFVTNEHDHHHSVDLVECVLDVTPEQENEIATCEPVWERSASNENGVSFRKGAFVGIQWSDQKANAS